MARAIQVTFDCGDPAALAGFWAEALSMAMKKSPLVTKWRSPPVAR